MTEPKLEVPAELRELAFVRDNDVEQALRILKRKMQREGVFREMRRRRFYEKPSDRTSREKTEAIRRLRKLARKQAIRDGLIAAPVRKLPPGARTGRDRVPMPLDRGKASGCECALNSDVP
ncbi:MULTISPECIES: 30S ribosomal protein S21 [unclassified Bradyrhizobium]|uniref:30S ribosomal protein S21 n=1 Tax=unclassified Bradyrhizobium TaxID=2631580 RepID=UPI00247949BC|nr:MULTISPECIES: 30S ribosomal protein S21 [unclassified Bradyrhizobium]WGR75275.1 30S ribosomal protein S21 [Bradyrhizobium sp. ISRA426]WGR82776.1 30S ribosomal protein S21 [Bradyrhizobium sp. ISRA430]WGR90473.1 30S ribosomal protein S21 [Bradyrhizobium sp. ISRA432]